MTATATTEPRALTRRRKRPPLGAQTRSILVKVLIGVILVIELYPLFWILASSLKTKDEFVNQPLWSLPSSLQFQNYIEAWTTGNLGRNALNSLIVTLPSLVIIIMLQAPPPASPSR